MMTPEYAEKYYLETKQALLNYLGGKCVKCNSTDQLEFDHINWRTKEFNVGSNWSMKDKTKLYAELDKCQLLCNSCHKEKTKQDQAEIKTKPINHGTMYGFMKRKCKCDVCDVARREWYDKRNAARRVSDSARGPYNQPAEHGTYKRYKRGCKCDLCRAANTAKMREQRRS